MDTWKFYGVCSCGYKKYAPFRDTLHMHIQCCPNCGTDTCKFLIQKMRWFSETEILKPWTWGNGKWITFEEEK